MVVIISITNKGWLDGAGAGAKDMTLTSSRNDMKLLLDRYHWVHDGQHDYFLFLTDYEYEYTDEKGVSGIIPSTEATKAKIIDGLAKAAATTNKLVIYYAGHTGTRHSGKSTLTKVGDKWVYEETGEFGGPPYMITADHQRITGGEFYAALGPDRILHDSPSITIIFDSCNASTFFDDVVNFGFIFKVPPIETAKGASGKIYQSHCQFIFVSSTHYGQTAGTLKVAGKQYGALTRLMHDLANVSFKAQALVEKITGILAGVPPPEGEEPKVQHPVIKSLKLIEGDFKDYL